MPVPRESKAARQERARDIIRSLRRAYPDSTCALRHDSPFQLLVATMLSAQTTDVKVNEVTKTLFVRWPDAERLATAEPMDVGAVINSIGLWRNKAMNAVNAAKALVASGYTDGHVPREVGALTALPGVGKKTATAVLGSAYGIAAGITVDTHMLRINRLLGLSKSTTADKMSLDLEGILPQEEWSHYTHLIIDHGRLVCVARRPRCGVCPLAQRCPSAFDDKVGYKESNDEREPASAKGLSWVSVAQ